MKYYHVYTKGLEDRQIFRDRQDYIAGMNLLAVVCGTYSGIKLLAFVLMSNHVHFVLCVTERRYAKEFIDSYKNILSRYIRTRYGVNKYLRHLTTDISEVSLENDGLRRIIAYVLNNPVKAGINCVAYGYEWSSARCYFNDSVDYSILKPLGGFRSRDLITVLHSNRTLPGSWLLNSSLYVEPRSYVDYVYVEGLFGRSSSMQYFMSMTLSTKRGSVENIVFSDSVIQTALNEILEKKYGVSSLSQLNQALKRNLIRDLKGRFTASSKQIARIVGMPINDIMTILDA